MELYVEVVSGQGHASGFVAQPRYSALFGFQAHPGTVNLLAVDPGDFKIHDPAEAPIYVTNIAGRRYLKVCPCTVDGNDALIIASWCPGGVYKAGTVVRMPDRTLFEVVAATRLDVVQPGARLTLDFDPSQAIKKSTDGA